MNSENKFSSRDSSFKNPFSHSNSNVYGSSNSKSSHYFHSNHGRSSSKDDKSKNKSRISIEIDDLPPNAYSTLGLNPMDEPSEGHIKSKYRKLAFKYHPDLLAGKLEDSDEKEKKLELMRLKFEQINEAYKLLMDAEERSKLDAMLKSHIEKKKTLMRMNKERREMREKLEEREKKKRKMNEELDFWSQKLMKAKQIVESGGYDELESIQIEFSREEKAKWLRSRIP